MVLVQVGYWFSTITFQWIVTEASGTDARWLGVLYFATFTPFLLFSLPAGLLADSLDRRSSLMVATGSTSLLAISCAVVAATTSAGIAPILLLAFLAGTLMSVTAPLGQALTANTVPADQLVRAVPLQALGVNVARVSGPALGGALILFSGPTGAFSAYAVVALGALLAASRIRPVPIDRPIESSTAQRESLRQRVINGIQHARQRPPATLALALVAATSILGASYPVLLPVLAGQIAPEATQRTFIILVTANGVGSVLGVLYLARRARRLRVRNIAVELLVLGLMLPLVALSGHLALTIVLAAICGALSLSIFVAVNTVLQQLVDDAQRGRVMSLYFMCWGGLLPFGGLGLGTLAGELSVFAALAIFGALAAGAALLILRRSRTIPPQFA